MTEAQPSDQVLVDKVKMGERRAFSELVRRHQKALLRISFRFMKELSAAEDVVQEAFLKAFERIHSFEGRSSFKSWLFQIAINTAKNKLRDHSKEMADVDDVPLAVMARAEAGLIHNSVAKLMSCLIEQLPFRQKTALVLRIYEDLSFKEISEIMECPYDTAKANYRHALIKLKEEIKFHKELEEYHHETESFFTELSTVAVEGDL